MTYESEHPIDRATNAVNELKKGKLPSTEQITRNLDQAASEMNDPNSREVKLSDEGEILLQKTEDVLRSTSKLMEHISPDDELQSMIYHSKLSGDLFRRRAGDKIGEVQDTHDISYDQLKQDSKQALEDLVAVLRTFMQSHNFRRLVGDFGKTVAEFARHYARKSDDDAQNAARDSAADLDEYEEPSGYMEAQVPVSFREKKLKFEKAFIQTTGEWHQHAKAQVISTDDGSSQQPNLGGQWSGQDQQGQAGQQWSQGQQQGFGSGQLQQGQQSFQQGQGSDADLDDVMNRLKEILTSLMENQKYQDVVTRFLNITRRAYYVLETSAQKANELSQEDTPDVKAGKRHMEKAMFAAKKLLENLADGYSLDDLLDKINDFLEEVAKDERLRDMIQHFHHLVNNSLTNKDYLESDQYKTDFNKLKEMNSHFSDKWYSSFDELTSEWNQYMDAIASDQILRETSSKWSDLLSSTVLDSAGRPTLKPELFFDLAQIAKLITERLKSIPVQRIEGSDEKADFVLDNLYIECDHLAPSHFHLNFTTTLDTDKDKENKSHAKLILSKMQTAAHNVQFYYKKKTTPKISDEGVFDIAIGHDGMELVIDLAPNVRVDQHIFQDVKVKCKIHNFKLHIAESRHQALYTILYPIIKGVAKDQMEKNIEEQLTQMFNDLDKQVVRMVQQSKNRYKMSNMNVVSSRRRDRDQVNWRQGQSA